MAKKIEEITRSKRDRRIAIFFLLVLIIGFGVLLVEPNATDFNANCPRDYFCINRCPVNAISLDEHGYPVIDKKRCLAWVPERDEFQWERCGLCLNGCPTKVLKTLNDKDEREAHTI